MTNPTVISEQPETIDNNQIAYNSNFNYVFAHNLQGHSDKVWSVAIERIVGGSIDGTIKVWNLKTGELQYNLKGHSDVVGSVAISENEQRIVSASWWMDGTIKVWNQYFSFNRSVQELQR